jgi:hypothetical protein
VGVVDHTEEGLVFREDRKQTQGAAEDRETIGDGARAERQGRTKGDGLGGRNCIDRRELRAEELVQAGERNVHLGFDAERTQNPHALRALDGGIEERALADAGLAANDERSAVPRSSRLEHLVDPRGLTLAPEEHRGGERIPESGERPRDFPGASAPLPRAGSAAR